MTYTVAIIGGGYSGVSIVLNLARFVTKPTKVILFEKSPQVALGAAYSTTNSEHLLNVRANNMSAFADQPNHFVEWLEHSEEAARYLDKNQPIAQQFLPRCIYGLYLQSLWASLLQTPHPLLSIEIHHEEVLDLKKDDSYGWEVKTSAKSYQVNVVVLATGNPAPNSFAEHINSDHILNNPWQDNALQRIGVEDSVLIIGTGLTMVDMVMSLKSQQHRGKIVAISRRACLPQRHQLFEIEDVWRDNRPTHLRTFVKAVRSKVKALHLKGFSWHTVVDALRPYTQEVWQNFSNVDKARFLRHLVPYWDTHRHRIAEKVHDVISELQKTGQLEIIAGRIQDVQLIGNDQVEVSYKPRGDVRHEKLKADWVVNCTGPSSNYDKISQPLFRSLRKQNLIATDCFHLGLRTNEQGYLLDSHDTAAGELYTLAALCKPLLWECIAVPDVRKQSLMLAKKIAEA